MPPRLRRLLLVLAFLGLAAGCAHRPEKAAKVATGLRDRSDRNLEVTALLDSAHLSATGRVSAEGTPFTRIEPAAPFDPRLIVTTQVAHADIFVHAFTGAGPRYLATERLYRGQKVFLLPFARNYGLAPDGRTDLTYEITIHRPDGSHDGETLSGVLWQEPVSGPGLILYPATNVSFFIEPDDPVGDYVITARVTDHLAGETSELVRPLTITDYTTPALPDTFNPQSWFNGYYQNPTPELALPALPRLFLELPADRRANALPPLLGFYDQLLGDNPWLLPAFSDRLASASPDEAYVLSLVLGHHLRNASEPPEGLDFVTWVRLEDFRTHSWPADADVPLARASQLDTLWGRFLASGLYTPVQSVLASLKNHTDLGAADRWQKVRADAGVPVDLSPEALAAAADPELSSPSDLPPGEVVRDVLLRTALWSLRGHARQHPLVRAYLDWTLRIGDLPPEERDLLERILKSDTQGAASTAAAPAAGTPATP